MFCENTYTVACYGCLNRQVCNLIHVLVSCWGPQAANWHRIYLRPSLPWNAEIVLTLLSPLRTWWSMRLRHSWAEWGLLRKMQGEPVPQGGVNFVSFITLNVQIQPLLPPSTLIQKEHCASPTASANKVVISQKILGFCAQRTLPIPDPCSL